MRELFEQETVRLGDERWRIGKVLVYHEPDSYYRAGLVCATNFKALYATLLGVLAYPRHGAELDSNTDCLPIRNSRDELIAKYGPNFSHFDYSPPTDNHFICLSESTCSSLAELKTLITEIKTHFKAKCVCPASQKAFASDLCDPVLERNEDFLVLNAQSILSERAMLLESCERLRADDEAALLAVGAGLSELEKENFYREH